jgi:hypothetical protein
MTWLACGCAQPRISLLLPAEGTSKSSSSLPFHELEKQVKDGLFTYPTRFTHFRRIDLYTLCGPTDYPFQVNEVEDLC